MKPRFSLRTLLLVMTLIAALFGWRSFNRSRALQFANSLNLYEFRNLEPSVANSTQVKMFFMDGKYGGIWHIQSRVDDSSSWSNWWRPNVVADCTFTEGRCGRYWQYCFEQTKDGFYGREVNGSHSVSID